MNRPTTARGIKRNHSLVLLIYLLLMRAFFLVSKTRATSLRYIILYAKRLRVTEPEALSQSRVIGPATLSQHSVDETDMGSPATAIIPETRLVIPENQFTIPQSQDVTFHHLTLPFKCIFIECKLLVLCYNSSIIVTTNGKGYS